MVNSLSKKYQLKFANWLSLCLCIVGALRDYVEMDFDRHEGLMVLSAMLTYIRTMITWVIVFAVIQHKQNERYFYPLGTVFRAFAYCVFLTIPLLWITIYLEGYFNHAIDTPDVDKFYALYVLRLCFKFVVAIILKYIIDSREVSKKYMQEANMLREANAKAQFEILKQQINPHFLFNALSTLKSLIRLQDPNAETFVLSLSDVYRKLLQRREKELIHLSDEIEIVNSYLFMQKLRFENNLMVEMNIPKDALSCYLPPFALQLLIENTIKHNIISQRKPLCIRVFVDDNNNIVVENSLQPKKNVEDSTGWGLSNLIERYDAFSKKKIEICETENLFSVALPLLESELG
jgi:two-component system, LytTR family, sensor kinase